jgi:IS1 family transposase
VNVLPFDQQVAVISALTEGCSIRSVERLTGVHRDTIMRLAARVGFGAVKFHDRTVHSLQVPRLELDEAWSFVAKKQRKVQPGDGPFVGDQYVFLAASASSKVIVSFQVGKRNEANTKAFIWDLRERIINAPELSTDAFPAYEGAIEEAFGIECRYGQIIKSYANDTATDAAHRYSPPPVVAVNKRAVIGRPRHISTSYAERQNLTLRMASRRFTRLTNGFSKRADYHVAAVGLFVAHFNFCRVHEALRVTPAMAQRITDHVWTIGELLTACLDNAPARPRKVHRRFTVIHGGKV